MILVDSSVWIDYFNGKSTWQVDLLDNYLSHVPIMMGDLILIEILQGFKSDKDFKTAQSFLSALTFSPMGGYDIAVQSALNYRKLRKAGITVRKTIDVIIATFCIVKNLKLLHNDHDFVPMTSCLTLKTISKPQG
jgi:predicted nucleic acid-binding protein